MAKTRKILSSGQITPPVEFDYGSQAAMIADQSNQIADFIYFDGTAHWQYLGTELGTIDDYRPLVTDTTAGVISLNHSEILALVNTNSLVPGKWYYILDFETIHLIPNTDVINTGPVEPLLLLATSDSTFGSRVYSPVLHPNDIIEFDFNNVLCEDGTTPRKGKIEFRHEITSDTYAYYDWRYAKWRRWKILAKQEETIVKLTDTTFESELTFSTLTSTWLNLSRRFHVKFEEAITHDAGAITLTLRKGAVVITKPLVKWNNEAWTANELSGTSGMIAKCSSRDVYVYFNYRGFGKEIVGTYSALSSNVLFTVGDGLRYDVDPLDFVDYFTFNSTYYGVHMERTSQRTYNLGARYGNNNVFISSVDHSVFGTHTTDNIFRAAVINSQFGAETIRNIFSSNVRWSNFTREADRNYFGNMWHASMNDHMVVSTIYGPDFHMISHATISGSTVAVSGNMFNFHHYIENSMVATGGSGSGEGRSFFTLLSGLSSAVIGWFFGDGITLTKRYVNESEWEPLAEQTVVDKFRILSPVDPSVGAVDLLGRDEDGNVVLTTEADPTVPAWVKSITEAEKTNWNLAFSWGDHGLMNYATEAWVQSEILNYSIKVQNSAGTDQFLVPLETGVRFEGTGDTSVSFNAATKTVIINSVVGAGGGAGVVSFNGRDGAVVSVLGDYNTSQVTELTNLYFTEARVRSTVLTGIANTNSAILPGDSVLTGIGKAQGQINNLTPLARTLTINGATNRISVTGGTQSLTSDRTWNVDLAPNGVTAGTYSTVTVDVYGRVTAGNNNNTATISLTGDVTGTGTSSIPTVISNNAVTTAKILNSNVTYAKIQNVTANRILGRTGSTGSVQELDAAQVRSLINVADGANNYVHPTGFGSVPGAPLTGASVISRILVNTEGHTSSVITRNLTLADLGYTGASNADNYSSWSLAASGTAGSFSVTSGQTVTFQAGLGMAVTRPSSNVVNIALASAIQGTDLSIGSNTSTVVRVDSSTGNNVNLPLASTSIAGILTASTQAIGGAKSFTGNIVIGSSAINDNFQRLDIITSALRGLRIRGNSTANAVVDLTVARTGANSDIATRGPNIELFNTETDRANLLQQTTGGLRFFQWNGSSWTNNITFNTTGSINLGAQATSTVHAVRADRTIQGIDGIVVNGSTAAQNMTTNLTIGVGNSFALDRLFIAKGVRTNSGTYTVSGTGTIIILFQNTLSWLSSYYDPRVCIEIDCHGEMNISSSLTSFEIFWNFGGTDDVSVLTIPFVNPLGGNKKVHLNGFLTINDASNVKLSMVANIQGIGTYLSNVQVARAMNTNYDIRLRGLYTGGSGNTWGESQTVVKVY